MRSFILTTSIIALSTWLAPVASAGVVGSAGGVAADRSSLVEPVARVCRQVCRGDICRTRCSSSEPEVYIRRDRDREVYRDRDEYREHLRHRPGVEVETPGFEFRVR
jgi:hypothetical protein